MSPLIFPQTLVPKFGSGLRKFKINCGFVGSHDIHCMRDMRDALGALGPVDGTNPELSNLTCSMTEVEPGDIVFVTSDGVSDNFDPVVGKFAVSLCSSLRKSVMRNVFV